MQKESQAPKISALLCRRKVPRDNRELYWQLPKKTSSSVGREDRHQEDGMTQEREEKEVHICMINQLAGK